MKKNKILLTTIFIVTISFSSFAQGGGVWNFTWNMGFPMGETSDFITQSSFRGFEIDGRGYVTDNLTVGGTGAWQVFYENFGWVTEDLSETTTINGYKRRYMNVVPLMVNSHYYFYPGMLMPYIGIGLGTYYIETRDFLGIYYIEEEAWHFGLAPEVGLTVPFGSSNTAFTVNVKYNWAAKTKDTQAHSWIGVGVGLSYVF